MKMALSLSIAASWPGLDLYQTSTFRERLPKVREENQMPRTDDLRRKKIRRSEECARLEDCGARRGCGLSMVADFTHTGGIFFRK